MVMGAASMLKSTPNPSEQDIARLMQGHVCRCGTYARIVRAVKMAAARTKSPAKPATDSGSRP
jgi:isoquinoline 1-oxidoreductase alpha subunit